MDHGRSRGQGFHGVMLRASAGLGALGLASAAAALIRVGAVPAEVAAQQPATIAGSLVFEGATVVDVEQGKLRPAQRVVIAGNRIQAAGDVGAVRMPKGAQVVDARGKSLIPGLWDVHTHSQNDYFNLLWIVNGVTGVRNGHSPVPLEKQVQRWQEILTGTHVGPPRRLLTGGAFGLHYNASDSTVVKTIVDSLKAHGANFLKVYPYSSTVAAVVRRAGIPFGGHLIGSRRTPVTAIEASDSGMTIFDHTNASKLSGVCFGAGASVDRCQPVADRFRQNGSWLVPTLVIIHQGPYARRAKTFMEGTPMQGNWLHDSVPGFDEDGRMSIAQRAGLPILGGSDADPPGFVLHAELATLVAEGLTPLNALQSATLNPAKLLHGTDSLGIVAAGKLADLVLLDADPLVDITNTTTIRAVVANGRYFDRVALDRLLAEARIMDRTGAFRMSP